MSTYQAKHKARGRYGVITADNQWLADFLGTKQQAIAKAQQLNQQKQTDNQPKVEKTTNPIASNKAHKIHFTLTTQGWLNTGEKQWAVLKKH